MKKVLVAVAAVLISLSAQALDGQLTLGNRGTGVDKIVLFSGGPKDGGKVDGAYSLQLFRTSGGSETPVGSAIDFRTGAAAGYIVSTTLTIPNFGDASGPATFKIRAFDKGTSFAGATTYHGESPEFTATVNVAPTPPVLTTSFPSFTLIPVVPEPSTIALAALGGAALLFRRRK